MMKTWRNIVITLTVLAGLSIISIPVLHAFAPAMYVSLLNDSGAIINGATAGASVFAPHEYVSALDSTGHIINTFGGGGTTITSGAGDFGVATAQSGAVLTGVVTGSNGNLLTSAAFGATLNLSTLLSQDCTVSGAGVVTCTKAGNGTGSFQTGTLGVGVAAPSQAGDATFLPTDSSNTFPVCIQANAAGRPAISLANGTTCPAANGTAYSLLGLSGQTYVNGTSGVNIQFNGNNIVTVNTSGLQIAANKTLTIASDNAVATMARLPMTFSINQQTALVANEHMGTFKTVKAITIENIVLDPENITCAVSATITCFDCGTSAGACTSAQTSTIYTSGSIATGSGGTSVDGTVSTAAVAAAHYITCEVTAGTCATFQANVSLTSRPQ